MEGVHIRLATVADAPTLAKHRCEMFLEMGVLSADAYAPLLGASEYYFRSAIADARYVSWVAEAQESIIAGGGMQIGEAPPRPGPGGRMLRPGPQGLIVNIYVEHDWRRRGVAKALVLTMIDFGRKSGMTSLVLHASDAGRGLYEKLGFEPTSEMRLFL